MAKMYNVTISQTTSKKAEFSEKVRCFLNKEDGGAWLTLIGTPDGSGHSKVYNSGQIIKNEMIGIRKRRFLTAPDTETIIEFDSVVDAICAVV